MNVGDLFIYEATEQNKLYSGKVLVLIIKTYTYSQLHSIISFEDIFIKMEKRQRKSLFSNNGITIWKPDNTIWKLLKQNVKT